MSNIKIQEDDGRLREMSDGDLLALLDMPYESEDEFSKLIDFDSDDEGDADALCDLQDSNVVDISAVRLIGTRSTRIQQEFNIPTINLPNENMPFHSSGEQHSGEISSESSNPAPARIQKKDVEKVIEWRKGSLQLFDFDTAFNGNLGYSDNIKELKHPYEFFRYFFNDEILSKILEETLNYSVHKNPNKPFTLSQSNLLKYLGILVMSSVLNLPNIRDYWHPILGNQMVRDTMRLNFFEEIRSFLHFNNNLNNLEPDDPKRDKLFKLRPIIDHLNEKFSTIPKQQGLSIDEQICATKMKHPMRQYNPRKPKKWGFKLFVLCDVQGYAYKFEIYSGQENVVGPMEKDLGANANVVTRLMRGVPENCGYTVYFDNYYTTIPLISSLKGRGIFSLGTIRKDRIPKFPFPSEREMKECARGNTEEYVTEYEECPLEG